jgi:hypothetical protein
MSAYNLFNEKLLRMLHPIHGRGVFQRSNIISDLIGSMRRMVAVIICDLKIKPCLCYI